MKRSGLKRSSGLKRKSALKQGDTPLKRTEALQRGEAPARRSSLRSSPPRRADPALVQDFFDAVLTVPAPTPFDADRRVRARCALCERLSVDPHHVLAKQHLKVYERRLGVPEGSLTWDADNGMPLCRAHHDAHENASGRIPRALIPKKAWAFAEVLAVALDSNEPIRRLIDAYPDPDDPGRARHLRLA